MLSESKGHRFKSYQICIIMYDAQQIEVINIRSGPLMISAGAGTGKTTVIIGHLAKMLEDNLITADRVLLVTFTVKAAENMKSRIYEKIGQKLNWVGTFHSISLKVLKQYGHHINLNPTFQIIDQLQQKKLLNRISININPIELLEMIELYKNTNFTYKMPKHAFEAYRMYEILKGENLDYSDILIYMNKLLDLKEISSIYKSNFDYIYIDEYQDTNLLQKSLIFKLLGISQNLICVGDEDQTIYEWRGAEVYLARDFKKEFPTGKILKLEYNYRSTKNILTVANAIIARNLNRVPKMLKTTRLTCGENVFIVQTEDELHEAILLTEMMLKRSGNSAILCRTVAQTRVITDYLSNQKIEYFGPNFYNLPEIQGCIAFLELIINPEDFNAFSKIVNIPKRNIGEKKLDLIRESLSISLEAAALKVCPASENIFSTLAITKNQDLQTRLKNILTITGYLGFYSEKKQENIQNFLIKLAKYSDPMQLLKEIKSVNITKNSKLSILTIHGAKGLEFDNVALAGWNEKILPHINAIDNQEIAQERRLAYVAITRAKNFLAISVLKKRGESKLMQSRFLSDLPHSCCTWI